MTEARVPPVGAQAAVFSPVGSGLRAEAVVQRLTEAITLGLLGDGEQLPSELELAGQFGVSTLTLREALAVLRQQGLVETRRGRGGGSFVRSPGEDFTAALRAQLVATSASELRDRGDEQAAVAGHAAYLAAERADVEDVARLRALVDRLATARERDDMRRADTRFHIDVAVASQSIRLTHAQVRLQGETGAMLWLVAAEDLEVPKVVQGHGELVDAIEAEDAPAARQLAQDHAIRVTRALAAAHVRLSRR
jgi:DNA-binding FadR family transcriptional regulator